jgi:DedD protein
MEKEQKKLLLVAVSVGVFLLVSITVALIMTTSKAQESGYSSAMLTVPPGRMQPVDISNIPPAPPVQPVQETPAAIDTSDEDSLTIQVPAPSTAAVPDNTDIPETTPMAVVTVAPPRVRQTPPAEPAAAPRPQAATRQTTTPAARPAATAAAPRPAARTINDYWIQTGAFKALVRAEDAKELLASKGLTSIIDTRNVNGETYYRVRLGPYTSEREANNWLTLVKSIQGFNDSQVRQTTRAQ